MIKKIIILLFFPFILMNICGCLFIVGGAVGAAGAYAVSKDTIQADTDKPYDALWNAALTVSRIRGSIKHEDMNRGFIELETDSTRVWIRIIRFTRATTRLRISARKHHLPNLSLAQEFFTKITEQAR